MKNKLEMQETKKKNLIRKIVSGKAIQLKSMSGRQGRAQERGAGFQIRGREDDSRAIC